MPKFLVTTDDGHGPVREGVEFPTEKAATDDAQVSLAEAAREKLPNGAHADFSVKVHDQAGAEVYRATLTFDAQSADDARRSDEEHAVAADEAVEAISAALRSKHRSPEKS